MLKLFICEANAGDYEPRGIYVAETVEEAEKEFERYLDEEGTWYTGTIWSEELKVDGYKISVEMAK